MIAFEVTLTRGDVRAFGRHVGFRRLGVRAMYSCFAMGFGLSAALAAFTRGVVWGGIASCLALAFMLLAFRTLSVPKVIGMPVRYRLDPSGLRASTGDVETHTLWRAIDTVYESATHFFLMNGRATGYIIPKRCITDPHDQAGFVRLIAPLRQS